MGADDKVENRVVIRSMSRLICGNIIVDICTINIEKNFVKYRTTLIIFPTVPGSMVGIQVKENDKIF